MSTSEHADLIAEGQHWSRPPAPPKGEVVDAGLFYDLVSRLTAALASTPSPAQPTEESFSVEVIYPEAERTLTSESAQTGSGSWDKFGGHTPTKQAQHEPAPSTDAARNADANLHSSDSAELSPQSQGRSRPTASTTTATGSDSSPSLAPSPVQGADDRLAQAEALIAEVLAGPPASVRNLDQQVGWILNRLATYQQSPQAALDEVRANERTVEDK